MLSRPVAWYLGLLALALALFCATGYSQHLPVPDSADSHLTPSAGEPIRIDSVPCIIITSDLLREAFTPLKERKILRGTPTEIVTVEKILEKYSGEDSAAKVRACIKHYYDEHYLEWVVLGGDETVIPPRCVVDNETGYTPEPIISDYYFACLDGDWNADEDSLYAEGDLHIPMGVDSTDLYPEVAVGRIPVSIVEDAANFVAKLERYESGEPYGWQNRLLALRSEVGGNDRIEDKQLSYVPAYMEITKQNDDSGGTGSRAAFFQAMNAGQHIVLMNGHSQFEGNYFLHRRDWWELLYNCDLDTLTNHDMPSVVWAHACNTHRIERDCLAEHFIRHPTGGAVAYMASSYYDWLFISDVIGYEVFKNLYGDGPKEVGRLLNLGRVKYVKDEMYSYFGIDRVTILYLMLSGDPQMRIWTDLPRFISQSQVQSVSSRYSAEIVDTVEDATTHEPVAGATVCLSKPDDVYCVCKTGSDGIARFQVTFGREGTATLCAGKEGYVWGEQSIEVSGSNLPTAFTLYQNYPNPFNPKTTIEYNVPFQSHLTIEVFNMLGQRVNTLVDEVRPPGSYHVIWHGDDSSGQPVATGVYLYRLTTPGGSQTRKMVLLK